MSGEFSFSRLLGSLFFCHLAGLLSLLFAIPSLDSWYLQLSKPGFAPPPGLFLPLWLLLYTLMGISLYLLWSQNTRHVEVKKTLLLFIMQLLLNILWASLFFGLHSLLGAALASLLLLLVLAQTVLRLQELSPISCYLLLPHLLWCGYLTLVCWVLLLN